uniref:Uncharacterized protein n=1 Tax=Anguilla anguilla TaxID=7936 RepID=A0A0E9RXH2_ANGAN
MMHFLWVPSEQGNARSKQEVCVYFNHSSV